MAMARVGMPGGHAPILHDLAEHRRVGVGVIVGEEREAADLAGPVTRLALGLEDPGHVARPGDWPGERWGGVVLVEPRRDHGARRPHPLEVGELRLFRRHLRESAALHGRGTGIDLLRVAVEDRVDRIDEPGVAWFGAGGIVAVLVVDGAAVAHCAAEIDEDRLVRSLHHHRVGELVAHVVEDRDRHLPLGGPGLEFLRRVARPRGHAEEQHPLRLVGLCELGEAGEVFVAEGTAGRDEDEDRGLHLPRPEELAEEAVAHGEPVEPGLVAGDDVREAEVADPRADEPVDGGGLVTARRRAQQSGCQHEAEREPGTARGGGGHGHLQAK